MELRDAFRHVLFLDKLSQLFGSIQDTHIGEGWIKQSFNTWCETPALSLNLSQRPGINCFVQCPHTHEKWQSSFCAAMQGRSLFTLALTLNPPGSSGLSLPDKLQARMWSLGAAPNPNLKSPLLPIAVWWAQSMMDDLLLLGALQRRLDTPSKMRGFNLVSGRNPAVMGIKHKLNNPNNSFWS